MTKFIQGFLAGFIIGLFGYFGYTSYKDKEFSIVLAIIFSLMSAITLGFLLTLDKGKSIDTSKVSPLVLNPDFDKGQSFKLTKNSLKPQNFAIFSFIFGITALFHFNLVLTPAAFIVGVFSLIRGRNANLKTWGRVLATLGVFFSLTSIIYKLYIASRIGQF
jgi:hypothetical protein